MTAEGRDAEIGAYIRERKPGVFAVLCTEIDREWSAAPESIPFPEVAKAALSVAREKDEDADVGRYLREHVIDCYGWIAMRTTHGPISGPYVFGRVLGYEHPGGPQEAVTRFFSVAAFGPCHWCLMPAVAFANGVVLEWPSLEIHNECAFIDLKGQRHPMNWRDGGVRAEGSPHPRGGVAQRKEQGPPTPRVGGSSPPAASKPQSKVLPSI